MKRFVWFSSITARNANTIFCINSQVIRTIRQSSGLGQQPFWRPSPQPSFGSRWLYYAWGERLTLSEPFDGRLSFERHTLEDWVRHASGSLHMLRNDCTQNSYKRFRGCFLSGLAVIISWNELYAGKSLLSGIRVWMCSCAVKFPVIWGLTCQGGTWQPSFCTLASPLVERRQIVSPAVCNTPPDS